MTSHSGNIPGSIENYLKGKDSFHVGVLSNPRSGGNKKRGNEIRSILTQWPEVIQREAFSPEGISEVLKEFAERGVDLIVVNGGDGTIQAVLTAIGNKNAFPQPPLFALLRAGTTSMLPRDIGIKDSHLSALKKVLKWSKSPNDALTIRSRPVLKVLRDQNGEPLFGMFFGAGAICEGIKIFHHKDNPKGLRGEIMPAITMLRLLLAFIFNREKSLTPLLTKTSLNGQSPQNREDLFVIVSTLERLFLGMKPYWGKEIGPLRYTAVTTKPKYLLRVIGSLFKKNKNLYATPGNGYFSHNVHGVQLEMKGEFTLDGELYPAGEGHITISAAGPYLFLC